jgi:hypothetical protein
MRANLLIKGMLFLERAHHLTARPFLHAVTHYYRAQQADGERNFHIFYYMLEGTKLKRALGLKLPVASFRYLGGEPPADEGGKGATTFKNLEVSLEADGPGRSGGAGNKLKKRGSKFGAASQRMASTRSVRMPAKPEPIEATEAKAEFVKVSLAMTQLGFSETEQDEIISILAGVLHMGNLGFTEAGSQVDMPGFAGYDPVLKTAGVLGVHPVLLANELRSTSQVRLSVFVVLCRAC